MDTLAAEREVAVWWSGIARDVVRLAPAASPAAQSPSDLAGTSSKVIEIQNEYAPRIKPCRKCGSTERKTGEFRASGGLISSFFHFATERFTFVSCGKCGYTEFYNKKLGTGSRIIDFLGD